MDEQHPLHDFLALGAGQADFVPWLLGESHQLHPWAVLACLRNVVAHGLYLPLRPSNGVLHLFMTMELWFSTPCFVVYWLPTSDLQR